MINEKVDMCSWGSEAMFYIQCRNNLTSEALLKALLGKFKFISIGGVKRKKKTF